jgi:structure-specific recognition protein 1
MAWKAEETEDDVTAMSSTDIKWARWLRVARGFQLRVGLKDRRREAFDGFERDVSLGTVRTQRHFPLTLCAQDHDKLASLLKQHFAITLETEDISFRGWNWGVTDFRGTPLLTLPSTQPTFLTRRRTCLRRRQ